MNTNDKNKLQISAPSNVAAVCRATCKTIVERINSAKAAVLADFRGRLEQHEHLLDLAVNEAEALAWQTGFPQLVFPTLAMEKAQTAAQWHLRQQSMRTLDSAVISGA